MRGRAFKYGDDINTDYIIAGKYRSVCLDMKEMAAHVLEDLDPEFVKKVKPGDFIVAGKNFGCGSSREYAPKVIIEAGVAAIIAPSFGRIFYRNSINSGLPLIECDTSFITDGDQLEIDFLVGTIKNITQNKTISFPKISAFMMSILSEGGVVGYLKKYKSLNIEVDNA